MIKHSGAFSVYDRLAVVIECIEISKTDLRFESSSCPPPKDVLGPHSCSGARLKDQRAATLEWPCFARGSLRMLVDVSVDVSVDVPVDLSPAMFSSALIVCSPAVSRLHSLAGLSFNW